MEQIRILLAEADPATRSLTEAFLKGRDDMCVCATATDGFEVLEHIRTHQPDLVLLDLALPGMDGLGVLQALGDEDAPPPVFVTSCFSDPKVISYVVSLGARYYLMKPICYRELPGTIRGLWGDTLEDRAKALLLSMGAPARCKGIGAAASAAAALASNPGGEMLLKEAYFKTIRSEQTDYACVEKNIRFLVGRVHLTGTECYRSLMGGLPPEKPDNDTFLHMLAACLYGHEPGTKLP